MSHRPRGLHRVLDAATDLLAVAAALLAALAGAAGGPRSPAGATGSVAFADPPWAGTPSAAEVRAGAARLPVAAPSSDRPYDRAEFPHWIPVTADCDTRCAVLDRQRSPDGWYSAYDGYVATEAGELEIDHVVPLAEAWQSGAWAWTLARRQAFANDLDAPQLLAVSSWSNRDKGAGDPAVWRPPDRAFWCRYAAAWVEVKLRWALSADPAELAALDEMAATC